jgi:hypothetical protein
MPANDFPLNPIIEKSLRFDTRLHLPFVARHRRFRWEYHRAVMTGELFELGIDLRIIPVGLNHTGFQVVDDDGGRDPTKISERVFQTANEALAGLTPHCFAVTLARMTQYRAK